MKFFADTRTKRNTAFVLLLLWLFALTSGVANACLLEAPGSHSNPHYNVARAHAHQASHAHALPLADHRTDAAGHGDADASKEACLKACDDGTRTVPMAKAGVDQVDPGPPPLVATLWVTSTHLAPAPRRLDELAIPIVGLPLRVRYSRLAL